MFLVSVNFSVIKSNTVALGGIICLSDQWKMRTVLFIIIKINFAIPLDNARDEEIKIEYDMSRKGHIILPRQGVSRYYWLLLIYWQSQIFQ